MNGRLCVTKVEDSFTPKFKYESMYGRKLLENMTGINDEQLLKGEYGKPYAVGKSDLFFNISHSNGYVACFVSDNEVGCDIQNTAKDSQIIQIAKRFFTDSEFHALKSLEPDEQKIYFYRIWCAKESYLKLLGTGLSKELNSFEVVLPDNIGDVFRINDSYLKEYMVDNEYLCTISSFLCHFPCEFERIEVI